MLHRRKLASAAFGVCRFRLAHSWLKWFHAMDIQAATEFEAAIAVGAEIDALGEPRLPFGIMAYVAIASGAEALWLGLIGWWLLNLF
jgi:hypothetical protein